MHSGRVIGLAAVASSTAQVCERKLFVLRIMAKSNPLVEPESEICFLIKECSLQGLVAQQAVSSLHSRYAETRKSAVLSSKKV